MDCSLPGASVCGISQARRLEWVAIFFSRGSSNPGNLCLLHWQVDSLPVSHQGSPVSMTQTPIWVILQVPLCQNHIWYHYWPRQTLWALLRSHGVQSKIWFHSEYYKKYIEYSETWLTFFNFLIQLSGDVQICIHHVNFRAVVLSTQMVSQLSASWLLPIKICFH